MNIKIQIKDCDCTPTISHNKDTSNLQKQKRNRLYAPPQRDKNRNNQKKDRVPNQKIEEKKQRNSDIQKKQKQSDKERQYEKNMLTELNNISKNQPTLDMVHNSNKILQRQNEILEDNQRIMHNMLKNTGQGQDNNAQALKEATEKVLKEVEGIRQIRDQIAQIAQQANRTLGSIKQGQRTTMPQMAPQRMSEMNKNLRNLAEVSRNHLEGLENMEGLKQLQNFNVQTYTQSINTLKKQIEQYQKQSAQIQRELRLRSAKLEKMKIPNNFEDTLLEPYEKHLKKKAQGINYNEFKNRVYEKLGDFDYSRFQYELGQLSNELSNEVSNYAIICKQYRIDVPHIRIDNKELRDLDVKLPNIIEEYKKQRGIVFKEPKGNSQGIKQSKKQEINKPKQMRKTVERKLPKTIQQLHSKPIDLANEAKYTDKNKKQATILNSYQEKRDVNNKVRDKRQKNADFDKYLEDRAREELQVIYRERKQKLDKMQKQLMEDMEREPTYLELNIRDQINRRQKTKLQSKGQNNITNKKQPKRQIQEEQYAQQFQNESEKNDFKKQEKKQQPKLKPEETEIKKIGKEVLREKLKHMLAGRQGNKVQQKAHEPVPQVRVNEVQGDFASGFINVINNTLAQVNSSLAAAMQKKSQQRSQYQNREFQQERRVSPAKIEVPRLEQFNPPPVFNMKIVHPSFQARNQGKLPRQQTKIEVKNYDYLMISDDESDLELSFQEEN